MAERKAALSITTYSPEWLKAFHRTREIVAAQLGVPSMTTSAFLAYCVSTVMRTAKTYPKAKDV